MESILLAFAAGWMVTYFFYQRRKKDSEILYGKLSKDARDFIVKDPRESLGLTDIIALFHEKIIDEHLDLLDGPFPYKRCPKCGSKKVRRVVLNPDGTPSMGQVPETPPIAGEQFIIACRSCGYHDEAVAP